MGLPTGTIPLPLKGLIGCVEDPSSSDMVRRDTVQCWRQPCLWAVLVAVLLPPVSRDEENH